MYPFGKEKLVRTKRSTYPNIFPVQLVQKLYEHIGYKNIFCYSQGCCYKRYSCIRHTVIRTLYAISDDFLITDIHCTYKAA